MAAPLTVLLVLLANRSGLRDDADAAPSDPTPSASATSSPGELTPLDVPPPPPSAEAGRYCPRFVAATPVTLDGLRARTARSESPYVGAWGEPPVVFRCGVPRPAALEPTSFLQGINGVQWLTEERGDLVVWTAVDRPVYIEVIAPREYASGPVNGLTKAVATLPAQPVHGR